MNLSILLCLEIIHYNWCVHLRCSLNAYKQNGSLYAKHCDGLELKSTFITNILKCVPPSDKPTNEELSNCSNHFENEIGTLNQIQTIVALGKVAFDNCIKYYKRKNKLNGKYFFQHGKYYKLSNKIRLYAVSYTHLTLPTKRIV